jgi:hypothetical protein
MGASKVRSSIHDNTVVESLPLVRNSQPTSRRIKLLICFLLLLGDSNGSVKALLVSGLLGCERYIVFPLARPRCLPKGPLPPSEGQLTFAVAQVYYPKHGPKFWSEKARQIVEISIENKLTYCHKHGYAYLNGTEWALENNNNQTTAFIQGLQQRVSKLGGPQPEMWFKPLYLQHLIQTFQANSSVDWILYMDMDTIVMNHDIVLTRLLAGAGPTDALIISPDAGGINTGVFLIANNEFGLEIINAWAEGITKHKSTLTDQDYLRSIFDDKGLLRKNNSTASLKLLLQCALQSTGGLEQGSGLWPFMEGTYARGDFCVHFFGRPDKLEQMRIASKGSLAFFSR